MTHRPPQRRLPGFEALALVGLVSALPLLPAALLPAALLPSALRAAPQPQPAPAPPNLLSPSWAFDPTGPFLPGADPPAFLLPNGGQPFNPAGPGQPLAIRAPLPPIPPCPLIVPARFAALQPLHIPPVQVPLKNRFGCLSAADAIYGPDGCPRRLCGSNAGFQITLPPGGP